MNCHPSIRVSVIGLFAFGLHAASPAVSLGREQMDVAGTLLWSTALGIGGGYGDGILAVAVAEDGGVVVAGKTHSNGFPVTQGAYDESYNGYRDAFIAKFNSTGTALLWSTFLGGGGNDWATSIAIRDDGNIIVAGNTESANFPTTSGAYDQVFNGSRDVFVAELTPDGSTLHWSTVLGGSDAEEVNDIVLDSSGRPVLIGYTSSSGFPSTPGAYDTTQDLLEDVFVTKLSTTGSSVVWSTFIGGRDNDFGHGVAMDATDCPIVVGRTEGSFPSTPEAFDPTQNGRDGFVAKLSADASTLVWCSFLGGGNWDYAYSVALDELNRVLVTGVTWSSDFPATATAYQRTYAGSGDAFVASLAQDGSALRWATYLGGPGGDAGRRLVTDRLGCVWLAGYTESASMPMTADSYDPTFNGGQDAFLARLIPGGNELLWNTFLGGGSDEEGAALVLNAMDQPVVGGTTNSSAFPITAGAYDDEVNASGNGFLASFVPPDWSAPPPFEISSVVFDRSVYQNGVETAYLTVTTTSNWGGGDILSVSPSLATAGGATFDLGEDDFTIQPGQEHSSQFSFAVPPNTAPWDFRYHVGLADGATTLAARDGLAFSGTPLTQAEIDQQASQLESCALLLPGESLVGVLASMSYLGNIASPITSGSMSTIGMIENSCRSAVYASTGDWCREGAAATLVAIGGIGFGVAAATVSAMTLGMAVPSVLAAGSFLLAGWSTVYGWIGAENLINWACAPSVMARYRSSEVAIGEGEKARALLGDVSALADSLGYSFATHAGIEGPVRASLSLPIGWITPDSTSLDESAALTFAPDTLQWFSISSRASRLAAGFDTTSTAADSLWPQRLDLRATRAGNVFVGLGVRGVGSGETHFLLYPTVAASEMTSMWVRFGDRAQAYPLLVDYDSDGQVDDRFFPEGISTEVHEPPVTPGGLCIYQNQPNPFNPRTAIRFDLPTAGPVRLSVYDLAGRLVRVLVEGRIAAGSHEAVWDGRDADGRGMASGSYFARLETNSARETTRMMLVR